jgi:hypothetical protein
MHRLQKLNDSTPSHRIRDNPAHCRVCPTKLDDHAGDTNHVRLWPKADTAKNAIDVAIWGKADMIFNRLFACR